MPRARPHVGIITAILLVIVLLPAAYMGAYYALLKERFYTGPRSPWSPVPVYHIEASWLDSALGPAHDIDREIRPDYWKSIR